MVSLASLCSAAESAVLYIPKVVTLALRLAQLAPGPRRRSFGLSEVAAFCNLKQISPQQSPAYCTICCGRNCSCSQAEVTQSLNSLSHLMPSHHDARNHLMTSSAQRSTLVLRIQVIIIQHLRTRQLRRQHSRLLRELSHPARDDSPLRPGSFTMPEPVAHPTVSRHEPSMGGPLLTNLFVSGNIGRRRFDRIP